MNSEIWKSIDGFEDYDVSNFGMVRSRKYKDIRIMKQNRICKNGSYYAVMLRKDNRYYSLRVHRIVLEAFTGTCPEGYEASHLDGNGLNNHKDNLIWSTHSDNCKLRSVHSSGKIARGERVHTSRLTKQEVLEIRRVKRVSSVTNLQLSEEYSVDQSTIGNIINRKTWSHI